MLQLGTPVRLLLVCVGVAGGCAATDAITAPAPAAQDGPTQVRRDAQPDRAEPSDAQAPAPTDRELARDAATAADVAKSSADASTATNTGDTSPPQRPGQGWSERDGVVVMEAERGQGTWKIIEDAGCSGGRGINDPGRGMMSYTFHVQKPGRWYLFLRAVRGSTTARTDDENDVTVEVNGARLFGSDAQTRPEGLRVRSETWTWTFLPKGPGAHTPDNIREGNVHFVAGRAGQQRLDLIHRSTNISIDRILLRHESVPNATALPTDLGPAETD
jgi:hypothetical protein